MWIGESANQLYRKFIVKDATNDDYASMYEVITRRFKRALIKEETAWAKPDLLVVDGGKGQLKSALAAIGDLGIDLETIDVVALAKERDLSDGRYPDRVYLKNGKEAIGLRPNTPELFVLARLRDEAHRFANTFHKKRRGKAALVSSLDHISGIGPARRKALLKHLGSVKAIESATLEQLCAVPGMNQSTAKSVRQFYDAVLEKRRSK